MIKGVFLDCTDISRGDISWEPMEKLCDYKYYLESTEEEAKARYAYLNKLIALYGPEE